MNQTRSTLVNGLRKGRRHSAPTVAGKLPDAQKDSFGSSDSSGKSVSLVLILVALFCGFTRGMAQPVRVQLPAEAIGDPGGSVVIPIEVGSLIDRNVRSYEATVSFDPNVIQATGASSSGTISGSFGPPIVNLLEEGKITIGAFGTSPLNGEGVLVNILFDIVGQQGDTTAVGFDRFRFNSGEPAVETIPGMFTIAFPTAVEKDPHHPADFSVAQNYPNPFNPSTVIAFQIPPGWQTPVLLRIFNVRGQHISTLVDGFLPPGTHKVTWDGKNLQGRPVPSGSYLYRLSSGSMMISKKMQLVR